MEKFGATTKKRKASSYKLLQTLWNKSQLYNECAAKELNNLRLAGWDRLAEAKVSSTCSQVGQAADCANKALKQLTDDALDRGSRAKPGDKAPSDFTIDTSILVDQKPTKDDRNDLRESNQIEAPVRFVRLLIIAFIGIFGLAVFVASLAVLRKTRGAAGFGLLIASSVFGIITWLVGAIVTFASYGWPGLFIGFFVLGIGVVPIGIIGALFQLHINGLAVWLCIMTVTALGSRSAGAACVASADRYNQEKQERRIAQAAQAALEHEFGRS